MYTIVLRLHKFHNVQNVFVLQDGFQVYKVIFFGSCKKKMINKSFSSTLSHHIFWVDISVSSSSSSSSTSSSSSSFVECLFFAWNLSCLRLKKHKNNGTMQNVTETKSLKCFWMSLIWSFTFCKQHLINQYNQMIDTIY